MIYQRVFMNVGLARNGFGRDEWITYILTHMDGNPQGVTCLFCEIEAGKRKDGNFIGGYAMCEKHLKHEDRLNTLMLGTIQREREG